MAYNHPECNRSQRYLAPPSMKEWLGEDRFVWFLLDAIGQMDLSAFHEPYRSDGKRQKAHHPEILLAVTLYGYCHGERSSRRMEQMSEGTAPGGAARSGEGDADNRPCTRNTWHGVSGFLHPHRKKPRFVRAKGPGPQGCGR